jgi:predicted deacylase
MKTEVLGEGEPDYAVVTCIHGDESCGWEAVKKLKKSGIGIEKPLKIILANEKAFEQGERFVDVDMNRVFPGDPEGNRYEEKVAYELTQEVEDLKFIDLHSTASKEAPFAIVEYPSDQQLEMLKSTGIKEAADMTHIGAKTPESEFVGVEVSEQSEDPVQDAYGVLKNFLAAEGVIEAEYEKGDPDLYEVYATEEGSGYEFLASNFQKVEEGQVYAEKEDDQKAAEQDFYPVLMSTDGYDDMIGFKAEKRDI